MNLNPKWEYVADGVMGGVSRGFMHQEVFRGRLATVLRGDVSLENNGGFIQIAFDICHDLKAFNVGDWDGIELEICGNNEQYDIRLRTDQLKRPWQSFRADFVALPEWHRHRIAFDTLVANKTDAIFDPAQLRRIGILAVGRVFEVEVAIASIRLYRFL